MVPNLVVALRTMLKLIGAFEFYNLCLGQDVRPHPVQHLGDAGELKCQFRRLCKIEGFYVLALVWKESQFVTDQDLARAGLHRLPGSKPVTRHALGRALKISAGETASCDSDDKYARRAQRIVDAGVTFGLIEPQEVRDNFKPLRATEKLHQLMVKVGGAAAVLLDSGD
jgi:hypothetical protein